MANPKTTSAAPPRTGHRRDASTTLTAAVVIGADAILPKGAAAFSFRAPSQAAALLAGKPGKFKPLLERYGRAVEQSREAGRSVSFRVDIDPSGAATVTAVDDLVAPKVSNSAEIEDAPDPNLARSLEAARERGRMRAAEILAADDMLSAEAFAKELGTSRVTVNAKRQNGHVLGLDGAKRGFRFPLWQLDREGRPYAELPTLHERLGGAWALYRFLVQPHGELDGLTGREALERGKSKAVLAAADSVARDFR